MMLYFSGLYPNAEGEYEKTGTSSVNIDGNSYNVDVYKDNKQDIIIKYYETETVKLILERSDISNEVKVSKINKEVNNFSIEVPNV